MTSILCKRGSRGKEAKPPAPPGTTQREIDLWLRPPWRGPMPHEIYLSLSSDILNDGTAIRLQGIRAVQNEQPYKKD